MAYWDNVQSSIEREAEKKYEELKKHITSVNDDGMINEFMLAHEHMVNMDSRIKQQEEQLSEYKRFFSMLDKLLPYKPTF